MPDSVTTVRVGSFNVRRLGFGTMQLTGPGVWGPPADHDNAVRVLRRAIELGVDFFDTADSYGPNIAEELLHEALAPYPEHVRIATKAGFLRPGPGRWEVCGRPDHLRAQCDGSLGRLGVECIDLFQLHRLDPDVPASEQFGVLRDLRDEGKVKEVGLSEVGVDEVAAALAIVPVSSVQNQYNLAHRDGEDVVEFCAAHSIAFVPWFPLASGRLARAGGPLDRVAREIGATTSQVSLAWLLQRSPVMLPIPGTRSLAHLQENCAALEIALTPEQLAELDGARRLLRRWTLAKSPSSGSR